MTNLSSITINSPQKQKYQLSEPMSNLSCCTIVKWNNQTLSEMKSIQKNKSYRNEHHYAKKTAEMIWESNQSR